MALVTLWIDRNGSPRIVRGDCHVHRLVVPDTDYYKREGGFDPIISFTTATATTMRVLGGVSTLDADCNWIQDTGRWPPDGGTLSRSGRSTIKRSAHVERFLVEAQVRPSS